ncbi:MAG TPA: family 10 glycosylhydrolase, partial [Rubrivivax sp.]|nr:family 10 glycosylhydrolase [Rubrivivax sp.]
MKRRACLSRLAALGAASLGARARAQARAQGAPTSAAAVDTPPPAPREFRAAWVATVSRIDWPSRPGLAPEAQRAEALAIVERARTLGLNALILQVRPAGDAIYPSTLEPWSEYLTGAQGRAPDPPWDPLAFWIAEAHRRGLELHAWFNPYRARHSTARSPLAAPHFALREPEAVKRYGEQLWMD